MSSIKNDIKICEKALVCSEYTTLTGDILIGSKTVIHPTAKILANKGKIIIGDSNLIEEYVQIVNNDDEPMIIGSQNIFEVGCYVESKRIGNNNILESKCKLSRNFLINNNSIIGAKCIMDIDEELSNNTVIYGPECKRRIQKEKPAAQLLQIDFLRYL